MTGRDDLELASASVRPEPSSVAAGTVSVSEHVKRFWHYLETETVRILVDKRREMENGCVYHDSSSFSNDVAKALVADRKNLHGWQPIATAPKDWSDVLLHDPNYPDDARTVFEGLFDKNAEQWRDAKNQRVEPTHWMPLPLPPAGASS